MTIKSWFLIVNKVIVYAIAFTIAQVDTIQNPDIIITIDVIHTQLETLDLQTIYFTTTKIAAGKEHECPEDTKSILSFIYYAETWNSEFF